MANNYGLSALMESITRSETTQRQNDQLMGLFEATVSDDIATMVTGDDYSLNDEDSVENDMAGNGIGYEEEKKLEKIIDTIPEDETDSADFDEADITKVVESVLGEV